MDNIDEAAYQEKIARYEATGNHDTLFKELTPTEARRFIAEKYIENQKPEIVKNSYEWQNWVEIIMNVSDIHPFIKGAFFKNPSDLYVDYDDILCHTYEEPEKSWEEKYDEEGYDEDSENCNRRDNYDDSNDYDNY